MAEMTKEMYGAIGRVGNKTYYQRMGKTIVRTITKPKNPKTEGQSLHRVLVKAVNSSRRDRYLGMTAAIPQVPVPTAIFTAI